MKKLLFLVLLIFFSFISSLHAKYAFAIANASDTLSNSVPAGISMHTIQFTTTKVLPANGEIIVSFPKLAQGDTNNSATASSSTFQLNTLSSSNIKILLGSADISSTVSATVTNPVNIGDSPTVTLVFTGAGIGNNTQMTIFLGCNTIQQNSCATQNPVIITPKKTNPVGTADIWKINLILKDASSNQIDSGFVYVAPIETVRIQATVEPFLTFIIAGVPNNTSLNGQNYCGSSHSLDTTNTGFDTTANTVNLGTLTSGQPHFAAQELSIQSNAINGYTIYATSSGKLTNQANGISIPNIQGDPLNNNLPSPSIFNSSLGGFGIHACDAANKVDKAFWGIAPEKFANPSALFSYSIINSLIPPSPSGDTLTILYALGVLDSTPGGQYNTAITYIATPTF